MKKKILYGILCLLLFILMGVFLVYCQREEKQQIDENRMLRETITDTEQSVVDDVVSSVTSETDAGDKQETVDSEVKTEENGEDIVQPAAVEDEIPLISVRGDAFQEEDKVEESGIGAALKNILEDNQVTAQVRDYSLYHAGSMAQLRLAGVDENNIDAYLKRHTDNEDNIQLSVYETKVRAVEDMDLQRDDQNGIPVICMGYYGGWYNDPDELIDQIRDILGTYTQQEKYLVAGLYPNVDVDKESYNQKMTDAWGEHYLQLDEEITHSPSTKEGRQDIAEAVFEKLQTLGYLKAGE